MCILMEEYKRIYFFVNVTNFSQKNLRVSDEHWIGGVDVGCQRCLLIPAIKIFGIPMVVK